MCILNANAMKTIHLKYIHTISEYSLKPKRIETTTSVASLPNLEKCDAKSRIDFRLPQIKINFVNDGNFPEGNLVGDKSTNELIVYSLMTII